MGQSGQATVELALTMSLLVILALGMLDMGRLFYTYVGITNAAREGARWAALQAPACDGTAIKNQMVNISPEQGNVDPQFALTTTMIQTSCSELACLDASVVPAEVLAQPDRRRVCITYPFLPTTPFVAQLFGNGSNIPLRTWATMPV
jgi:Flp pilus assembly protein TadG